MHSTGAGNRKRRRILLVDDAVDLREVYQLALEHEGYEVRSASDGEEALEVVQSWRPDLVVTDIFMAGIGGLELITRLRSDFAPPVPDIVALSGFPDAREEALRRGALRFALKPVSLEGLLELIEDGLARDNARRASEEASDAVEKRRSAARAVGQAMLDILLERSSAPLDRMHRGVYAMSRFFGHSTALVLLLREGRLTVAASSDPRAYPLGGDATDLLSLANDVVDSASTIVLPSMDAQALLRRPSRSTQFFVGVPYLIDRHPVGAMCLVDSTSHDFASSELGVLEYVAARSSAQVSDPLARPMVGPSGLLSRIAFETLLAYTLQWAGRSHAAMGVTLFAPAAPPPPRPSAEIVDALPGPRMLVGLLDHHRVAAFSAAETVNIVRDRLEAVRTSICDDLGLGACAELTFEAPVPQLAPDILLRWADDILVRATAMKGKACVDVTARWTAAPASPRD